jgi:acetylornithine/succinyldiaminopimelate/putrescine aminotransferase
MQTTKAHGSFLYDPFGKEYLDLSMGFGSAFLGHGNTVVRDALIAQIQSQFSPGFFTTHAYESVVRSLSKWLPVNHRVGSIYSGGTEAVEVAMRIAAENTGRKSFVGFRGAHHGRSWLNRGLGGVAGAVGFAGIHSFALSSHVTCEDLFSNFRELLQNTEPAAVFFEPIHMSDGGFIHCSPSLDRLIEITQECGSLVIFDELLTGGYRCGSRFYYEQTGYIPDILVAGKAIGGGYPCAIVSLDNELNSTAPEIGVRSTFTNNPLACVAIEASIVELEKLEPLSRTKQLSSIVQGIIEPRFLFGMGAMWCVEWPDTLSLVRDFQVLQEAHIVVSFSGRFARLLPALVIDDKQLANACELINRLCRQAHNC